MGVLVMTRHNARLVLAVVLIVAGLALLGTGAHMVAGTAGLLIVCGLALIVLGAVLPW